VQQLDVSKYLKRPRRALSEAGADTEDIKRTGPVPVVRRLGEMPIRRIGSLPAAGRKI
jgi:hypothetical protein